LNSGVFQLTIPFLDKRVDKRSALVSGVSQSETPSWTKPGHTLVDGVSQSETPGWTKPGHTLVDGVSQSETPGWTKPGYTLVDGVSPVNLQGLYAYKSLWYKEIDQ
jgi:hypothetical protein